MQDSEIQQIADKINYSISWSTFYDSLENIEVYENSKDKSKALFLYWNMVTLDMLKSINETLGTDINCIFPDEYDKVKVCIDLKKVIQ